MAGKRMQTRANRSWLLLAAALLLATAVLALRPHARTEAAPAPDLSAYPWVYLRDGRSLTADEPAVELIAVGDVMLGRGAADTAQPLAAVAPWLAVADLTFGNLEAVLVDADTPSATAVTQPIRLHAPTTSVAHLTAAGFDLLSLANNHSLDAGPQGLAATAVRLHTAGVTPLGAGADAAAAYAPHIRHVNGLRLAFLAFNAVPQPGDTAADAAQWQRAEWDGARAEWDEAHAVAAVSAARTQADVVIVSMHWGYEYEPQADPAQQTAVTALFAAGADLVLGHHPHVVQALHVQRPDAPGARTRLAAYSLGNFVFDQGQHGSDQGLALRLFVDAQGVRAVQALPVWAGLQPRLMSPADAAPLLARIQPPPARVGFACAAADCQPAEAPQTAVSGRFWSGAIDLTGDGQPETIRRAAEQVTVYENGAAVWTSPPTWRVVDVALGDPNDDGRFELLLAIWQTDAAGYARSQPYIVGYRGGAYKLLWGGRPLARPISEVELGDVDGDGKQELVVAEADAIAVWRWQGWNFSLLWRSESGRYQDVALVAGNGRLLITAAVE